MHPEHRHKINRGIFMIGVGLLVILNELYQWIPSWPLFIGLVMLIVGFLHMLVDREQLEAEKAPAKKKK
ncbi:MAG: hypothetical protein KJ601_01010 [Nanoarchaeota archaeon]|nr:hypothetical protein [Nanoarchaeota archaeon]MBU1705051.1 hypothetical protein [Nanoarchaeota archaeon]